MLKELLNVGRFGRAQVVEGKREADFCDAGCNFGIRLSEHNS